MTNRAKGHLFKFDLIHASMRICWSQLDRDAKKSKFSDCLAELSAYSGHKSKKYSLKKFLKIFQNG